MPDPPSPDFDKQTVLWVWPSQWPVAFQPEGFPFLVNEVWRAGNQAYIKGDVLSGSGQPTGATTILVPLDQPRAVRGPVNGTWTAPPANDMNNPHRDGGFVVNRRPSNSPTA